VTSVTSVVEKTPGRPTRECLPVEGVFSTTENTEVTEALGSLTSHTAGLRIRFNVLCWFTKFRGQPRRRCRSRVERIETAIEFLCVLASLR